MPIISVSSNKKLLQKECINRGVIPHYLSEEEQLRPMEDIVKDIFKHFREHHFISALDGEFCNILCLYNDHSHGEAQILTSSTLKIF